MSPFDKQVVGIAQAIAEIDCGGIHRGNWRLPCPRCIERERELSEELRKVIHDETVRRNIARGHDERDGNKTTKRVRSI